MSPPKKKRNSFRKIHREYAVPQLKIQNHKNYFPTRYLFGLIFVVLLNVNVLRACTYVNFITFFAYFCCNYVQISLLINS